VGVVQKERESLSLGQLAVIDFLVLARAQVSILSTPAAGPLFSMTVFTAFVRPPRHRSLPPSLGWWRHYHYIIILFYDVCVHQGAKLSLHPEHQNEQRLTLVKND
jgi:hypothetical protein